nr:hypothetical protein [Fodinibius salinus]
MDDTLEYLGLARVVPYAFGIDDRHRTFFADTQAVCFGTVDASFAIQI